MEIKTVRPSHPDSYERLCHDAGLNAFLLPLRDRDLAHVRPLEQPRLERAIGVIYHPTREQYGNYVPSVIPLRYDAFIYLDETRALHPLHLEPDGHQVPETYPFGV